MSEGNMGDGNITPLWRCDICKHLHDDRGDAIACAAQGRPEVPAWLALRKGRDVCAFGEDGVSVGRLRFVWVSRARSGAHVLLCNADVSLSNNMDDAGPVAAFDPMRGLDFLRYCDDKRAAHAAVTWARWCGIYGMPADPTLAEWWAGPHMTDEKRAAFLRGLVAAVAQAANWGLS